MATKVPAFTYSGTSSSEVKGGYWYIYLKSSGTLKFTYAKKLEACIVGGGAAGQGRSAADTSLRTYGGGGGTVLNKTGISASAGTGYSIVIGSGGKKGLSSTNGSASTAFGYSASGGSTEAQVGVSNTGLNGTYAFGDSALSRYGGGGGRGGTSPGGAGSSGGAGGGGKGGGGGDYSSGGASAVAGATNTGGGGGGYGDDLNWQDGDGWNWSGGGDNADGGSGIVILRGTQDDLLPVKFNGVQIAKMTFNGQDVTGLIYGGARIFARRCKEWLYRLLGRRFAFRRATPAT